jgi:hypothetical protein
MKTLLAWIKQLICVPHDFNLIEVLPALNGKSRAWYRCARCDKNLILGTGGSP